MKRYTVKDLRKELEFVNEFTIHTSAFKITLVPQNAAFSLYQAFRGCEDNRIVRLLFAGTARECKIYLDGLKAHYWYFAEDSDLPF